MVFYATPIKCIILLAVIPLSTFFITTTDIFIAVKNAITVFVPQTNLITTKEIKIQKCLLLQIELMLSVHSNTFMLAFTKRLNANHCYQKAQAIVSALTNRNYIRHHN